MKYFHGSHVVPQSFTTAAEFLSLAAAQGHANAQNTLGFMYMRGQGVKQSYDKGFIFFKQAADQGLPNALYGLGLCCKDRFSVEKSLEGSFELLFMDPN